MEAVFFEGSVRVAVAEILGPQHMHETTDPRWAALAALAEPDVQ
jgi:hypothetical protein